MKVVEIIRAALTRLGIYATGEEVPADDAITALNTLNGLLSEYELQPLLNLPVELYLPLSINDDLVMTDSLLRVIILGLAIDLAPDYGVEPSQSLLRQQSRAMVVAKRANAKPIYTKSDWCNRSCLKLTCL